MEKSEMQQKRPDPKELRRPSIGARLGVRYIMRNSDRSKESRRATENLAAVVVTGILGMIMIWVLGKARDRKLSVLLC
jgi:hypothetical protein